MLLLLVATCLYNECSYSKLPKLIISIIFSVKPFVYHCTNCGMATEYEEDFNLDSSFSSSAPLDLAAAGKRLFRCRRVGVGSGMHCSFCTQ